MSDRFSIRDAIAAMDEENDDWEEIAENHTVREYENHEDRILDFADTAETWIRAALEVLTAEQIGAIDEHVADHQVERVLKAREEARS